MSLTPAAPATCACSLADASIACPAWCGLADGDRIDVSHFSVCLFGCPACGAIALSIWTELISWDGEDDDSATVIVPLDPIEVAATATVTDARSLHRFLDRLPRRPWLIRVNGVAAHWRDGQVVVLPHS